MSDPIERFVSTLNVYFSPNNKYSEFGVEIFKNIGYENIWSLDPEERVGIIFDNLNMIKSNHQKHHFDTQVSFVDRDNFSEFRVITKKDVASIVENSNVHNKTHKEITIEHLNDEQIDKIKIVYKEDYDFISEHLLTYK